MIQGLLQLDTLSVRQRSMILVVAPSLLLLGAILPAFVIVFTDWWWLFPVIMATLLGVIILVQWVQTHRYRIATTNWEIFLQQPMTQRRLWDLSPQQFMELVGWMFAQMGYRVEVLTSERAHLLSNGSSGELRYIPDNTPMPLSDILKLVQASDSTSTHWWFVSRRCFPTPLRMAAATTFGISLVDGPLLLRWCSKLRVELRQSKYEAQLLVAERVYQQAA